MSATVPRTARPTRQVRPTTSPRRLRMALMRCSVPLDAGAVVVAKLADTLHDVCQILRRDRLIAQHHLTRRESGLGQPPEVQDNLENVVAVLMTEQRLADAWRAARRTGRRDRQSCSLA